MKTKVVPISSVKPYEKNPRKNNRAIDKVAESLREYGFRQPIVVDAENTIIAGHTRLLAAKKLKLKKVPVHVADGLSPDQVKAYRLMDNRSHEDSEWEQELLAGEIQDLMDQDFDLTLTGFEEEEIENLLLAEENEDLDDENLFEQSIQLKPPQEYVVIRCESDDEFTVLREVLGLRQVRRGGYKKGSPFDDIGTQRVVNASQILELIGNVNSDTKHGSGGKSKES